MRQTQKRPLWVAGVLAVAAVVSFLWVQSRSGAQPRKGLGTAPAGTRPGTAALQTYRNLGKAYYEQGKYTLAAAGFQKVVKSGHATIRTLALPSRRQTRSTKRSQP